MTAAGQPSLFDGMEEDAGYTAFVDKFKPKRTTDDCETPPEVYDVVLGWVREEYGLDDAVPIVRPFWPGWDYERFDYPDGCVVVDNPPFSILSRIVRWYRERGIAFFLFAPALTMLSSAKGDRTRGTCAVAADADIEYGNGAVVRTSFLTSLEPGIAMRSAPELCRRIREEEKARHREKVGELPKYTYPDEVVTATMANRYAKYGVDWRVPVDDCAPVSALESQRAVGKTIYGSGLLLSPKAAAEKAAAEKVKVTVWELSPVEQAWSESLG